MGAGLDKITGPASCFECKTAAAAAARIVTHEHCGPLLQPGVVEEDQSDNNLLKPRAYGAYWLGSCDPAEEVRPGRSPPRQPLEDDYDPRKPEYVREASEQEMAQAEAEQLRQQMLKLEVMLESRSAEPKKWHVLQHYRHVLEQMRKREFEVLSSIGEQGESSDEGSGVTSATSCDGGFSSLDRDGAKEFDVITRGETTSTRCSVKDLFDNIKDLEQNADGPSCQVDEHPYAVAVDAAQRFCVVFQPGRSLVLSDLSGVSML